MAKCPICGNKIGLMAKTKASDGDICYHCASICADYATQSIASLQSFWNKNNERWSSFTATQKLKSIASEVVTIDEVHRFFVFGDASKINSVPVVFSFDEVESYEFETVGGKTVTKKKGGITRAVVGGVVAGPVGALVGSGTAKTETQTVGAIQMTKVHFKTYAGKVERSGSMYPLGFTDFLDRCIAESVDKSAPTSSPADEILKYKQLLDQGIITADEFSAKKKQLLGL